METPRSVSSVRTARCPARSTEAGLTPATAVESLLGYSTAQPSVFKDGQLAPVKDLKLLVRDYAVSSCCVQVPGVCAKASTLAVLPEQANSQKRSHDPDKPLQRP
jgi:hypothetical protein